MIDIRAIAEAVLLKMGRTHHQMSVLKMNRSTETLPGFAFLVFVDDEKAPLAVIKASTDDRHARLIEQEFNNLNRIQACRCDRFRNTVPEPLFFEKIQGFTILAETVKPGVRMKNFPSDTYFPSARFGRHFDAVVQWLYAFHQCLGHQEKDSNVSDIGPLLENAVERFRNTYEVSKRLEAVLNESLEALTSVIMPLPPWHGDFCTANILVSHGSSITVIDWEYPVVPAWPLSDLLYFIASIWSIPYKKGSNRLLRNYYRLFFTNHRHKDRIRHSVSRYLRQLGVGADDTLFLSVMIWVLYANRKRAETEAIEHAAGVVIDPTTYLPLIMIDDNRCLNLEMLAEHREAYILNNL